MDTRFELLFFISFFILHGFCLVTSVLINGKLNKFGGAWGKPFRFFSLAFAVIMATSLTAIIWLILKPSDFDDSSALLIIPVFMGVYIFWFGLRKYLRIVTAHHDKLGESRIIEIKNLTEKIFS
jgi:hypothetical protein